MIKRGRPKGATAYPEHAVCIKCQVFRPKRRGYCDRCRPRNRGAAAKTASNPTTNPAAAAITTTTPSPPPTSSSSVGLSKLVPSEHSRDLDAMVTQNSPVAGQSAGDDRPAATASSVEAGSRGVKRQRHNAAHGSQKTAAAQIRGKRRRTVSAPVSANNQQHHNTNSTSNSGSASTNGRLATSLRMVSSAMQAFERNRNVDVVSAYAAAAGATAKDRKPDGSPYHYPTGTGSAAHQLALLLPRSDGTAVDVVPLQFLSTTSPTATVASPSPALTSSAAASPTSSPSVTSTHSLMSLANVSALAAARYPSPSTHSSSSSWSSSPPSSPHRPLLHSSSSPYSSPPSSSSSSLSFALPQPRTSACGGGGGSSSHSHSYSSRAGDLVLPSLGSLALPRPALPLHFFPTQASAGLHLASMVAPAAPLRLAPN